MRHIFRLCTVRAGGRGAREEPATRGAGTCPIRGEIPVSPQEVVALPACSSRRTCRACARLPRVHHRRHHLTTPRGQRVPASSSSELPVFPPSRPSGRGAHGLPFLPNFIYLSLPHAVFRGREHARAGRLANRRRCRCATLASRQPWRAALTRLDLARPRPHTGNSCAAACEQAPSPARRARLRTQPSGHVPPPHRCANLPVGCAASYAPLVPVACVNDCMGRGACHDGVCECQPGWTYFDCSIRAPTRAPALPPRAPTPASPGPPPPCAGTCAADCSGAGLCFNGTCQCREGFCGGDCSQVSSCGSRTCL